MKVFFTASLAILATGSAFGSSYSYELESVNSSVSSFTDADLRALGLVFTSANSGKATYNFKIIFTPDTDSDSLATSVIANVTLAHVAVDLAPNQITGLDDSEPYVPATTVPSTTTWTDSATGAEMIEIDGQDGGNQIPDTNESWTEIGADVKTVTLSLQADGTSIGYVTIDTNTVTLTSSGFMAGEVIQVRDIQTQEGS